MNVLEKILEEIEHEAMTNKEIGRKQCEGMARAMNIIRSHMDEAENDDWISVEERLPEIGKSNIYDMNLVTLEDWEVCLGVYHNPENEWWTRRQEGKAWYTNKRNVVAWKPLPAPYKPKKQD